MATKFCISDFALCLVGMFGNIVFMSSHASEIFGEDAKVGAVGRSLMQAAIENNLLLNKYDVTFSETKILHPVDDIDKKTIDHTVIEKRVRVVVDRARNLCGFAQLSYCIVEQPDHKSSESVRVFSYREHKSGIARGAEYRSDGGPTRSFRATRMPISQFNKSYQVPAVEMWPVLSTLAIATRGDFTQMPTLFFESNHGFESRILADGTTIVSVSSDKSPYNHDFWFDPSTLMPNQLIRTFKEDNPGFGGYRQQCIYDDFAGVFCVKRLSYEGNGMSSLDFKSARSIKNEYFGTISFQWNSVNDSLMAFPEFEGVTKDAVSIERFLANDTSMVR